MPSRQDQLHSYQFVVQRVVAALVMWETDPAQSPFRRIAGAMLVGVLLAALGVGGAAAISVISPGGSGKWRNDGVVIVEKESGALYVYRADRLHPVLNYASALLILNKPGARTVSVSRRSIADAPRGVTLGIRGAPMSLPGRDRLHKGSWAVCSSPEGAVLFVGGAPAGGTALEERGVLLSAPDGPTYLLWRRHKHLVREPEKIMGGLVWSGLPVLRVARAFVNALPTGADLARLPVPGRGRAASDGKIGQVYAVRRVGTDREDFFVLTADGLASLTRLQATLVLTDPDAKTQAVPIDAATFAGMVQGRTVRPFVPDRDSDGALPADVPALVDNPPTALCASVGSSVSYGVPLPDLSAVAPTRSASAEGTVLADRVVVRPGTGALVKLDTGDVSLVTDQGRRHTLASSDALAALGYGGQTLVSVPAQVAALIPAGPALDPTVAPVPVADD